MARKADEDDFIESDSHGDVDDGESDTASHHSTEDDSLSEVDDEEASETSMDVSGAQCVITSKEHQREKLTDRTHRAQAGHSRWKTIISQGQVDR